MGKLIKLFILNLILLIPITVNAECSVKEKQDLLILSKKINYKYNYDYENNVFKITFYNIDEKLKLANDIGLEYSNGVESKMTYSGGYSRKFTIMASDKTNCPYEIVKDISVKFPIYNKYSENEVCKDSKYDSFKYCEEFLNEKIDDNLWNKELKKYDEKLENKSEVKSEKNNNENLLPFIITFGVILLISIVVIITIFNKKKKRVL